MRVINRLKNPVSSEKEYYVKDDVLILTKTPLFSFADDKIAEDVKEAGIKLVFRPNVYTIRKNRNNGDIELLDISGRKADLPNECAHFRPSRPLSEIVYNGYMLCIDKDLANHINPKDQSKIKLLEKHFTELTAKDPQKICLHELRHLQNYLNFADAHAKGDKLNDKHFMNLAYFDEMSATCAENLMNVNTAREAEKMVKQTCKEWMNNPSNQAYTKVGGFFEGLLSEYQRNYPQDQTAKSETLYNKLLKDYFTFEINGKKTDLSHYAEQALSHHQEKPKISLLNCDYSR